MPVNRIKKAIIIFIVIAGIAGLPAGFFLARDGVPALAALRAQDTSTSTQTTVRSSTHGDTKTVVTTTVETIIHSHDGIPRHKHVITVVETETETSPSGIFHFLTTNQTSAGSLMPGMSDGSPMPGMSAGSPMPGMSAASQNTTLAKAAAPPDQTTLLAPSSNEVTMLGRNFFPADLTVPVGTTVIWTNKDSETHSIATDSNLFSGSVSPYSSLNFTFNEAGVYNYYCELHSSMTGIITVQ